jgi:acetyl esterase/lipase
MAVSELSTDVEWIELWQEGAPYTKGTGPEDRPAVKPYILNRADGNPSACIVVCPGGGYSGRAAHESDPIAQWLNSIGVSAVVLRYRVKPYQHPCPLLDAQRAIRYVRHQADAWNIDANRVGVLGFSAGGHLASSVSVHYDDGQENAADPIEQYSSKPNVQVLCYPVITFDGDFSHKGSRLNLLGEEPDEALIQLLSSEKQVTEDTPPAFIWHTADDRGVVPENSLILAMALLAKKVPHEMHIFEHGRHGLGILNEIPDVQVWTELCERWLIRQGMME